MPTPKEKPKVGKPKIKPPLLSAPKQAGRRMAEQYRRQLDRRVPGEEGPAEYATDKLEGGVARGAADTADTALWGMSKAQQKVRNIKERRPGGEAPRPDAPSPEGEAPTAELPTNAPEHPAPANPPKERGASHHPANAPKERPTASAPKERRPPLRASHHAPVERPEPLQPSNPHARPGQATSQITLNNNRRGAAAFHTPVTTAPSRSVQSAPGPRELHRAGGLRGRTRAGAASVKTRANLRAVKAPTGAPGPKIRPRLNQPAAKQAARYARQTSQRHMTRQMVTQARKAAKTAATLGKKLAAAVTKAAALVGSIVGLVGGGILLVALVVVIIIAAVANSPFGLFFAAEPNAPDTVSVAQAVATVNMAYNAKLEELQSGDYDDIVIHGQGPDWPDVLAVFAVKLAGADADGLDVATLDAARMEKLTAVFWDMTAITSYVEEIDHPGDGEDDPSWTEYILHITITAKTTDDMRTLYGFTPYQSSALDELLSDHAALSALAEDLTITNADLADILENLPDDLSPERREAVRVALQLVGKVNYFWGGKSSAIGWDSRWGTLQKVTAAGSSTTGTYRPYGLDCTGFVDWVYRNAGLPSDGHWYIGTNLTELSWADALPGDIALFPDASHVGIVVGRSAEGGILVCHCSYSQNNVVVTDCATTGFAAIGRPDVFE